MLNVLRLPLSGGLAALALTLASCATTGSTPYQPIAQADGAAGGFSEERIAEGAYRVTFAGNRLTSRETVETYLLYRAAELTLEQGYDWFSIEDRELEHEVERQVTVDPYYDPWYGDYAYWRPYWRYYVPNTGWRIWSPYSRDPFWGDRREYRTVERFEASADVRMAHGVAPATDLKAFDARDVLHRLGPSIQRPGD